MKFEYYLLYEKLRYGSFTYFDAKPFHMPLHILNPFFREFKWSEGGNTFHHRMDTRYSTKVTDRRASYQVWIWSPKKRTNSGTTVICNPRNSCADNTVTRSIIDQAWKRTERSHEWSKFVLSVQRHKWQIDSQHSVKICNF